MKRYLFVLLIAIPFLSFAQLSPRNPSSIQNATTAFGVNVPEGSLVYDVSANKYYYCTENTAYTNTLTTASANFVEISAAVVQWITNGTAIYYNLGNVGIGNTNPDRKLTVSGIVQSANESFTTGDGAFIATGGNPSYVQKMQRSTGSYAASLMQGFATNTTTNITSLSVDYGVFGEMGDESNQPWVTYAYFGVGPSATYDYNHLRFYPGTNRPSVFNGYVGIGKTNPGCALDVNGLATVGTLKVGSYNVSVTADCSIPSAGGTNPWAANGTKIYYNTGNVGIGTSDPLTSFHIMKDPGASYVYPQFSISNAGNTKQVLIGTYPTTGVAYMQGIDGSVDEFTGGDLALNPNDGNVGIGTTNPSSLLEVNGLATLGSLKVGAYNVSVTADCSIPGTGSSQWTTNGTSIYYNSGNVGIGTTSPLGLLHIYNDVNSAAGFYVQNPNAGAAAKSAFAIGNTPTSTPYDGLFCEHYGTGWTTSGIKIASESSVQSGSGSPGGLLLGTGHSSADLKFFAGGSSGGIKMILKPSGNVGIGTTNPVYNFDVVGNIHASTNMRSGLFVSEDGGGFFAYGSANGTTGMMVDGTDGSEVVTIQAADGNNIKIDNVGHVGIGAITSPTHTLEVNGTMASSGGQIDLNESSNYAVNIATGTSTGAVNICGTGLQTVNIATASGVGSSTKAVYIGTSTGSSTVGIYSGTGGTNITSTGGDISLSTGTTLSTSLTSGSGGINLNAGVSNPVSICTEGSTGTITLGGSTTQTIAVGDNAAGAKTINIGNAIAGTSVNIKSGTSSVNINASNSTSTTNIGTGTTTGKVAIGNTSSGMEVDIYSYYPGIGIPVFARVTGSDATTTGQSLVDITGLSVPLLANNVYEFEANLLVGTSAVTTGTKYGVNYSTAGSTVYAGLIGSSSSSATKAERISALNSVTGVYLATSGQTGVIKISGILVTGANSGNLTIQHLKVTSGTSTVYIGSFLKVTRVS